MTTEVLDLKKVVLDLSKQFELNLVKAGLPADLKLQTRLAIDASGSMDSLYDYGWVDRAVDLFLAAALKFDDNGELEVSTFGEKFKMKPVATIEDAGCYLRKYPVDLEGATNVSQVIEQFALRDLNTRPIKTVFNQVLSLFGKREEPVSTSPRVYLGIITDGHPSDKHALYTALKASNPNDVFIHFFGIGKTVPIELFKGWSEEIPNMDFSYVENPIATNSEQFYSAIVNSKLSTWCK